MSEEEKNAKAFEIVESGKWDHADAAEAPEMAELEKAMISDAVSESAKLSFLKAMLETKNPAKFYGLVLAAKRMVSFCDYETVEEKKAVLQNWNYLLSLYAIEIEDASQEELDEAIAAYDQSEIGSARVESSLLQIAKGAPRTFE